MRRPLALFVAALCAAVVAGCATPTTSGSPRTPGSTSTLAPTTLPPTSSGTPMTPGSPTTDAPTVPAFDPTAATVVIEAVNGVATIAGPQGTSRLRVYGDGRLERTAPDGIGTVRLKLDDDGVATLLAAADRLGMLSDPDLGDIMITDVGSASLTIRLRDRTIDLEVIGPGIKSVGSPAVEQARANFSALLAQLWSLDGVGIAQQPRTEYPHTVSVSGFLAEGSAPDDPWPLSAPARSVFAASSCALVSGADVEHLAAVLTKQQRRPSGSNGGIIVATGDVGVPALVLRVSSEHPQCTPAPAMPKPLPKLPWPADGRERAGQWQHWQAVGALDRAMTNGSLPVFDLTHYEFEYVSGTVGGAPVVDVVATADERAGSDAVRGFVARVDLSPAEGPVVSRTVTT